VEPLAGERLGNVGARTSRLGPQYFERQQALAAESPRRAPVSTAPYRMRNDCRSSFLLAFGSPRESWSVNVV